MADYDDKPLRDPKVTPHFPCDSFTPSSKCPHKRKYKNGVRLVCMVCEKSGVDHFKALKRDPRTDPKPEPKASPKKEARKAKRAAKHDPKKAVNAKKLADKQRLAKMLDRVASMVGAA